MFDCEILENSRYRVTGYKFNCIYKGSEQDAQLKILELKANVSSSQQSSLVERKKRKIREIHNKYQAIANKKMQEFTAVEISTFPDQKEEYKKWKENSTALTPTIDYLATVRKIDRELLLRKIGANIKAQLELVGKISREEDIIKSCNTVEELELI